MPGFLGGGRACCAVVFALLAHPAIALSPSSGRFVDSQGRDYFSPETSALVPECQYSWDKDPPKLVPLLTDSDKDRVAVNLRATREPSIVRIARPSQYEEVLRFTWWHEMWSTTTIRIELGPEKSRLIAKQASRFYRQYERRLARTLTDDEASQIRTLLAETRLFDSRPDDCAIILDGTNWFFESNGSKGYDFVQRTSPGANAPAYIIGKHLFGLTGWKSGALQYAIENARIDKDEN